MLFLSAYLAFDAEAVFKKCEKAIFTVNTSDGRGTGFAVKDGKFLLTCDHVVGTETKIEVLASKNETRFGCLVAHDPELDVALYRLDMSCPVSLKIATDKVNPGSQVFVIGSSLGFLEKSISQGIVAGVRREGDRADIQFDASISSGNSGSPLLNSKGEVIGMAQFHLKNGNNLNFGLSGFNIDQFLRQKPKKLNNEVIGNLGQAVETTNIYASPNTKSRIFYTAKQYKYLIVSKFTDTYHKVVMSNGVYGYARASQVAFLPQLVRSSSGAVGIANGAEVVRLAASFDESTLRESSTTSAWLAECANFVKCVFSDAGREISSDVDVQLDIGTEIKKFEDMQAGDRIYFRGPRAAIYLGDGKYASVTKNGKLTISDYDEVAVEQTIAARH